MRRAARSTIRVTMVFLFGVIFVMAFCPTLVLSAESDYYGTYAGSYSGDDRGYWVAAISSTQKAWLSYSTVYDYVDAGYVSFISESGGVGYSRCNNSEFQLVTADFYIDSGTGSVTGTWDNSYFAMSGSISGKRVTACPIQGSYSGTYAGDANGTWRLAVGYDGYVTGEIEASGGKSSFQGGAHPNGTIFCLGSDSDGADFVVWARRQNSTISGRWVNVYGEQGSLSGKTVTGNGQDGSDDTGNSDNGDDNDDIDGGEEDNNDSQDSDGFDWGDCSGSGNFEQQILEDDSVVVGDIPSGKEGVYIELQADDDVDIQLFDKASGEMIIGWTYGDTSLRYRTIEHYRGMRIEYSGYWGVNNDWGHEYIKIEGMTTRDLEMKAFGYAAGYADVDYSWTWTDGCQPDASGSGTFRQEIKKGDTMVVGTLPPGISGLRIDLTCSDDVDIQLFDKETGTRIIGWVYGDLSQKDALVTSYRGMTVEYSGYEGVNGNEGHEYIIIPETTSRFLEMRAFGYASGYATVEYSWGGGVVTR